MKSIYPNMGGSFPSTSPSHSAYRPSAPANVLTGCVQESPQEVNELQERLDTLERETLEKLEKVDIRRRDEVEELKKDVREKVEGEEGRAAEVVSGADKVRLLVSCYEVV